MRDKLAMEHGRRKIGERTTYVSHFSYSLSLTLWALHAKSFVVVPIFDYLSYKNRQKKCTREKETEMRGKGFAMKGYVL